MAITTTAPAPKTSADVLTAVAAGQLTVEQATALLAALAPKRAPGVLSAKVSAKGALSVYGLQRMPVTLYAEQWERLLDFAPALKQALKDNASALSRKA